MTKSLYYPQKFNFICLDCWLPNPTYHCPEYNDTPENRANCPLRRVIRARLPDEQASRLLDLRERRRYPVKQFVRMVEIQAEWNRIPVGGL
jgi:hypothetical protein